MKHLKQRTNGVSMLLALLTIQKLVHIVSECVDESRYGTIVVNGSQRNTCFGPASFQAAAKICEADNASQRVATRLEETLHIDTGVIEVNHVRGGAGVSCRSA
jgi:N-acetylglutamate synthase/N-acetylornithine aminotransferase